MSEDPPGPTTVSGTPSTTDSADRSDKNKAEGSSFELDPALKDAIHTTVEGGFQLTAGAWSLWNFVKKLRKGDS